MDYELEERPGACILRVKEDMSGTADQELKRVFVRMRQNDDTNVVMDMREVAFMDSTVLGTLVWAMKNMREADGDLRLFGLRDFVARLFDITGLDQAFKIFPAESDALESFGPSLENVD